MLPMHFTHAAFLSLRGLWLGPLLIECPFGAVLATLALLLVVACAAFRWLPAPPASPLG